MCNMSHQTAEIIRTTILNGHALAAKAMLTPLNLHKDPGLPECLHMPKFMVPAELTKKQDKMG